MRHLAAILAVLAALLLGASCSGDDDDAAPTTTTEAGSPPAVAGDGDDEPATSATEDLSRYADVSAMADDLQAGGITCALEYEGLRDAEKEVSICTIDGEFAQLTVWLDPEIVETLAGAADGTLAHGQNWTVDVDTAATAQQVAAALGGAAPGGA